MILDSFPAEAFRAKYLHAAKSSKTALLQKPEVFVGLITFISLLAFSW